GGFVAAGVHVPELAGAFVFTDFCSHRIWSAYPDGAGGVDVTEHSVTTYPASAQLILPVTFGVGAEGEILVADYVDGEIYRVAPAESVTEICDGLPNVTGSPAQMDIVGAPSLTINDLGLEVEGAAPYTLGVLFYGPAATAVPTGNGLRCVDGGDLSLFRAGVRIANGGGEMHFPLDLTQAPFDAGLSHVTAGSTWVFQAWYRDVGGPLGAPTNFSSALAVRFRP
ncbi:MAG: hypothetical protein AAGG01_13285, partial [Planctomycetota bacterium]